MYTCKKLIAYHFILTTAEGQFGKKWLRYEDSDKMDVIILGDEDGNIFEIGASLMTSMYFRVPYQQRV